MNTTMKRAVSFALFGLGIAALAGCPIYPADRDHRVCLSGDCYDCPDSYYSGACRDWVCDSNGDCPSGYVCNSSNRCAFTGDSGTPSPSTCAKPSDCPAGTNCGADNACHAGDCSTTGCPADYACKVSGGVASCQKIGGDGGWPVSDCKSDKDCAVPAGSKCLSGKCTEPKDQCADTTQCPAGLSCVDGACTPACSASKPCPTGFACDTAKGVCTENPTPCTTSSQCTGGNVCVDEHCVAPCGPNNACAPGLVCLDGGCTPDEKPVFTCQVDGVQDSCAAQSICLRHSCYIGCDADAGTEACKNADQFNVCKPVTTSSGTFHVCGSDTNLGTDCDPTQGRNCTAPLICIDGFCK